MTRSKFATDKERREARAATRHRSYLRSKEGEAEKPERPENHYCPSCRIRFRLTAPRESYNPSRMTRHDYHWLVNAAKCFDREAGDERFTAAEFMAWIRPDTAVYGRYHVPESGEAAA